MKAIRGKKMKLRLKNAQYRKVETPDDFYLTAWGGYLVDYLAISHRKFLNSINIDVVAMG